MAGRALLRNVGKESGTYKVRRKRGEAWKEGPRSAFSRHSKKVWGQRKEMKERR